MWVQRKSKPSTSTRLRELAAEAQKYNNPSTFAKYAKIQRQLKKLRGTYNFSYGTTRVVVWLLVTLLCQQPVLVQRRLPACSTQLTHW